MQRPGSRGLADDETWDVLPWCLSDGRFPRSRSLGPKCVVWVEAEIDDWMREIVSS